MNMTKFVLKKPVTTLICILCLIVFGVYSAATSKMELTPEMEMPMMMISTVYPGASPEDVNDLVTRPIESAVGILGGIKETTSISQENVSLLMLQYEYGTDMDKAYSDLKKKIDGLNNTLPEDANESTIMEFNMNEQASMIMAVKYPNTQNLYNFVNNTLVPELEKLTSVASADISGGRAEYVRVELIPEKMSQYHLNINSVAQMVGSADFSFPAGQTKVGDQSLSISSGTTYDTAEKLKKITIPVGDGNIIYLEDIANVYNALEESNGISRYDGEEIISVSLNKQQSSTAVDVSNNVKKSVTELEARYPGLDIMVINDASDQILGSLESVAQTLIMAVLVSMVIIFLFFGDFKASFIVGTSIPLSILAALIMMRVMGFSLNVITMSSLVLGVGMMVDNSIVVLESCFRSKTGNGFQEFRNAALKGMELVIRSIIGSTITTCVVFVPMALLQGMVGQIFKPLGFTIVFCMLASLVSAMTIVPLCYTVYRPKEKDHAPLSRFMAALQSGYRNIMVKILPKKVTVMLLSVAMLILSFVMATQLKSEMMPSGDEGTVQITIDMKPGLSIEKVDEILGTVEAYVTSDENLDSYVLTYGGSGLSVGGSAASLVAYLKDDRTMETDDVAAMWRQYLCTLPDSTMTVESYSMMSSMSMDEIGFSVILQSAQYDDVKQSSDQLVEELKGRTDVTQVHTSLENAAPVIKLEIDPVKTAAEGLTPVQVASTVNTMLGGVKATTIDVDGQEVNVMVEYSSGEYDTLTKVRDIVLPTATGGSVSLMDLAEVEFKDSPQAISRTDKQYQVTVTANYTEEATQDTYAELNKLIDEKYVKGSVALADNAMIEMMNEEFGGLYTAIGFAVFLIFVVMAAQFESPKFSIMVMTTIPFSLIGSFGLLFLADASISMPSLLGFLMLVGTVVNNGILYVDTVNQFRGSMDMESALIEAGATRLRPIMMTTLTTIVAMIPMAMAYGDNGEMMQGLALVNVGGLIASTVMALLMLPVYYTVMNRKKKDHKVLDLD